MTPTHAAQAKGNGRVGAFRPVPMPMQLIALPSLEAGLGPSAATARQGGESAPAPAFWGCLCS